MPSKVKEGCPKEDAEKLKKELEDSRRDGLDQVIDCGWHSLVAGASAGRRDVAFGNSASASALGARVWSASFGIGVHERLQSLVS